MVQSATSLQLNVINSCYIFIRVQIYIIPHFFSIQFIYSLNHVYGVFEFYDVWGNRIFSMQVQFSKFILIYSGTHLQYSFSYKMCRISSSYQYYAICLFKSAVSDLLFGILQKHFLNLWVI